MHISACCVAAVVLLSSPAFGQFFSLSVDLLDPNETTGTIPDNFRVVDIFVDVPATDVWSAGGLRTTAENSATINYWGAEPEVPGTQPGLINGGVANQFYTSLSRPRGRFNANRFTNAAAVVTGAFDPAGASPVTAPTFLNVTYQADPPPTDDSFSVDGYIARVSVDVSAMNLPLDYDTWGADRLNRVPAGAIIALRSTPADETFGTMVTTLDVPEPRGIDWALWVIPEPATALLLLSGLFGFQRRV
jgi:hypothetical protein